MVKIKQNKRKLLGFTIKKYTYIYKKHPPKLQLQTLSCELIWKLLYLFFKKIKGIIFSPCYWMGPNQKPEQAAHTVGVGCVQCLRLWIDLKSQVSMALYVLQRKEGKKNVLTSLTWSFAKKILLRKFFLAHLTATWVKKTWIP